jgi:cytidine deaminase
MGKAFLKKSVSDKELIDEASKERKNAYVPYSGFKVGATILTSSGKIFSGANVENVSFGLTVCAERVAVFKAVSSGERKFEKIVIVSSSKKPAIPCGACLQVLSEFAKDLEIVCANLKGKRKKYKLKELLPESFKLA